MTQGVKTASREHYHHGDLRAHLIETVRVLVEEKGADGFSISEAARRAGVSSAAPYKHFNDRGEIVREVALAGISRMRERMEAAAAEAPEEGYARVTALGMAYAAFARSEPGVFRLMFGLTKGHEEHPEIKARGEACFDVVKREVRAVLPAGTPPEVIDMRALMLHMFVHGHAFLEIDGKHDVDLSPDQEYALMSEIAGRVMA